MKFLKTVKKALKPIILNSGFELWDISVEKEGKNKFLRVYVIRKDKLELTLDDCEFILHKISKKLDEINLIKIGYFLEVSAVGREKNGLEKKQILNLIGCYINLKFKRCYEGKRRLKGILKEFNDEKVVLQTKEEIFHIPLKNCLYIEQGQQN